MAEKGWTAQVAAAAGVAAGTGAAQLGLGYGLGVVEWPAVPGGNSVWLGSLGWATWIAANATVFGAVIAGRLGRAAGGPWRLALAASAAVGALLTVALIALPTRTAVRTDTFSPPTIAGGYAALGVLLGLVIAYWAVAARPVAANLIATAAWLWSLAVAAVVATIFWHRPPATHLSSWQFLSPADADGIISWPSAALTLLAALVVGIIGVLPTVRRGDLGVGAASSGAVGPLLVAAAFFALAPQLTGTPRPLLSAYLIAPYAVLAGLAGSALTVALGQRRATRRATAAARRTSAQAGPAAPGANAETDRNRSTGAGAARAGAKPARSTTAETVTTSADTRTGEGAEPATGRPPAAVVPSPRPAATGRSKSRTGSESAAPAPTSPPAAARPAAAAPAAAPDSAPDHDPRPRRSFMDRIRRRSAGQGDTRATEAPPAVVTGRAQAPASDAPRPAGSAPPSPGSAATAAPSRGKPATARPADTQGAATGNGESSTGRSAGPPSAVPPRGKSPAAPPAGTPKPATASADRAARPATAAAPGRSDSRSTVAPPPNAPPIAKINEPQSGEMRAAPQKSTARPRADSKPGPANTASSDKAPPAPRTPTKSTKATPRPAASPRSAGGKPAAPAKDASEADTAELPVQDPRRPSGEPPT